MNAPVPNPPRRPLPIAAIVIGLVFLSLMGLLLYGVSQSGRANRDALPSPLIGKPAPAFALPVLHEAGWTSLVPTYRNDEDVPACPDGRYNLGLSQRRADAVKSYLAGRGIGEGVITTQAFGETNLRVQTADGVRELQNRRVEITYGPGSGQ